MATTIVTKKGSGAPAASDLVEGELAVDTTNGRLYTENSSAAVVELGSNPSGNITFGDNGKAIFGAGSDLQIYHDGSNSYIEDSGTGALFFKTNYLALQGTNGHQIINAEQGGAVELYHANSRKLLTTATGVDITGSATMDGLTVDGGSANNDSGAIAGKFNANGNEHIRLEISTDSTIGNQAALDLVSNSNTSRIYTTGSTGLKFSTDGGTTAHAVIDGSGNVSIGTTTVNSKFNVASSQDSLKYNEGVTVFRSTGSNKMFLNCVGGGSNIVGSNSPITFNYHDQTNNNVTERMRIDASGNVGIGTSNPTKPLHVESSVTNTNTVLVKNTAGTGVNYGLEIAAGTNATDHALHVTSSSGTSLLRVDGSGNVGIGTSSPTLVGFGTGTNGLEIADATLAGIRLNGNAADSMYLISGATKHWVYGRGAVPMTFSTNGTEAMRLDASGNLLVGATSNPSAGKLVIDYARGTSAGMRIKDTTGAGGTGVIADFYNSSNTSMGAITHDSSNITYGGTSDYRLKENVDYEFDGLAAVAQLKPTKFTWIDNPNVGIMYGFIAHEVSDVVAQAVVGEKDAVNEDGSVKPQMLDQSKLIPFLTKAIQEQQATIEALTARIAALES